MKIQNIWIRWAQNGSSKVAKESKIGEYSFGNGYQFVEICCAKLQRMNIDGASI